MINFHLVAQSPPENSGIAEIKSKEILISKGQYYLNFPVNNDDQLVRARIKLDGKILDQFTINLADGNPEFWTFFDLTPYQDDKLIIEIEEAPSGFRVQNQAENEPVKRVLTDKGLDLIHADSKFPGMDSLYSESGRPQVHFSAQRGWINDPNGLVFYNGEYHLYFQHNPYGWQWGNMHWGHAVSKDLIHWEQLPEAIYPVFDVPTTGRGDAAFSGSAFIDPDNTGGFRKNGIDPLIAMYTSTARGESMKFSYDNGRTFEEYESNPILVHNGRDPKIFWYEPGNHWVMIVWSSGMPKNIGLGQEVSLRQHSIYTSDDLKNWDYQSGVEGMYECPELFELQVEGSGNNEKKWVMYDAFGRYVVGDFDGKKFIVEQPFKKYEYGGGYFYASQTYSNEPNNKVIQVGWGRNITNPGMPFNQPMLFPTELKLKKTSNGYVLAPTPIEGINSLYQKRHLLKDVIVTSENPAIIEVNEDTPLHLIAEFERGDAPIILDILGYQLKYDNEWEFSTVAPDSKETKEIDPAGPFSAPTVAAPIIYPWTEDIFKIEAIVDKNILEIFINDGEIYYVTNFSGEKKRGIEAVVQSSRRPMGPSIERKFIVRKLEVNELKSIWN